MGDSIRPSKRRGSALAAAVLAVTVVMLGLDLTWLGIVAGRLYDTQLGPLKRPDVVWQAALLFYGMYVTAVVAHAVLGARHRVEALRRGAALGFVAYATYELTNWSVLRDWPPLLVPVDIAWGVVLTAIAALAGKAAHAAVLGREA